MSNVKFFYGTTIPTTSNLPDGGIHFNTSDSKIITVRQGDTLNEFLGTDQNVMQWYNSPETSPSAPISSDDILPLLASNAFSGPLEDGESAVGQAQCVGGVGVSYKGHIHAAGFLSTDNGFYGKGNGLTDLNADNVTSGTLPVARGGTGCASLSALAAAIGLGSVSLVNKNFNADEISTGNITEDPNGRYTTTVTATFSRDSLFTENPRSIFRWKVVNTVITCRNSNIWRPGEININYAYDTSVTSNTFRLPTIRLSTVFYSDTAMPLPANVTSTLRLQIGTYV